MGYSSGEALILTQLQNVTGFTSGNTARGKWSVLNSGNSNHYAIIRPGPFVRSPQSMAGGNGAVQSIENTWTCVIEVWRRVIDDGSTYTDLQTHVDNIITRMDKYRKLGDTAGAVRDSFTRSGDEPEELWSEGGNGPSWVRWKIYVRWEEEVNVTLAE